MEKLSISKSLNYSLQQIASGSIIVFAGVIISMALTFTFGIILVRYTSQDEFGVYSLALTIVSMVCAVAILGLDEGASRYIAFFLGKSDNSAVKNISYATLKITLATSLLGLVTLFLLSDLIAISIFHSHELSSTLKIISFAIPFTVLIQVLTSITRGFNISKMNVMFNYILKPLSFLAMLTVIVLLDLHFDVIIFAYVASMAITLLAFAIYAAKWFTQRYTISPQTDRSLTKDLLRFSVPLLSVNMLIIMMSQATMLLLGYFKTPADVGKFNIALMMGSLVLTVLTSLGYIYTPTASNLYGKNNMEDLKRSYIISTKWAYTGTMPILFVFLVFPGVVINILFGSRYSDVAFILQILSLGYMVNTITGPNYHTLIAIGKTRVIFESFLVNAFINLAMGVLLIPGFGIIGAAISVSVSALVANTLLSVRLYQQLKIHPLTRSYIISIATSSLLITIFFLGVRYLAINPTLYVAITCFVIYMIAYGILMILLKTIDREEFMLLSSIEKKFGLHIIQIVEKVVSH